ncbi:helix-turn-helix domain-containing protein [Occallatibacter savannae]|uniref:helix-turn-helix domain-containing protein n=1 Tax=Occallatibacter savannae TaxID=1002691 RepID=UPI000D687D81|nr:helix-turn-helix domain-containing protein [Occallatibacter savannae]
MSKFWREHPATPHQQALPFNKERRRRKSLTQADVLIGMLRDTRSKRIALELPEIMKAGIAQHGARFKEIREQGFEIRNEMERTSEGVIQSRYWLTFDPEVDAR